MLRPRLLLLLLAVSLTAVALAACGGGGGPSSSSGGSDEEKRLAFEDCLRKRGIDIETSADGSAMVRGRAGAGKGAPTLGTGGPEDPNGPFAICRRKTGWAPSAPTAAQKAEMRDRALRMARCMRSHGVDVADPAADGRMLMRIPGDSPTFRAAAQACGLGGPSGDAGAGDSSVAP